MIARIDLMFVAPEVCLYCYLVQGEVVSVIVRARQTENAPIKITC